jgi:hypothetical protein
LLSLRRVLGAPSAAAASFVLVAVAACGRAEPASTKSTYVYAVTSNDTATSGAPGKPGACMAGERAFRVEPGAFVSWTVVKAGDVPVVGRHAVTGRLAVSGDRPYSAATLQLDFDLSGALSQLPLRDDRLRKYFFGATSGQPLRFRLTSVTPPAATTAFPDAGVTVPLALAGTLSVAGVETAIDVPVLLSGTADGLRVTPALDGLRLDIRRQLGLGASLDALLALVGAKMADTVELRFDLALKDACR